MDELSSAWIEQILSKFWKPASWFSTEINFIAEMFIVLTLWRGDVSSPLSVPTFNASSSSSDWMLVVIVYCGNAIDVFNLMVGDALSKSLALSSSSSPTTDGDELSIAKCESVSWSYLGGSRFLFWFFDESLANFLRLGLSLCSVLIMWISSPANELLSSTRSARFTSS